MDKIRVALQVTSIFEGGSFDNVTGNFDGQGISVGVLQWNYGQGTLQKLLQAYIAKNGSVTGFPADITPSASMNPSDAIKFAQDNMLAGMHVDLTWLSAWKVFLNSPGAIAAQEEMAVPYGRYADYMCSVWKLPSLRAYCFFFDIRVQNGSMMGLPARPPSLVEYSRIVSISDTDNKEIWRQLTPTNEQMILMQGAADRAEKARAEFQHNILARKGTIAMGQGFVNEAKQDLRPLFTASTSPVSK